jgi:hypothetical protein
VYYTPTYIVDYIVKNTVGKLLEEKTPKEAASLKIVDPACGSGSFLLGAYQYLLDWYLKWYSEHDPLTLSKGKAPVIYQAEHGEWRLTTVEKKRILLDNIHGVDIDPQAVEVTKLSLSLKVLEGESKESIGAQMSLFKERALPDLGKNIQCGNSLIGPDYYEGRQLSMGFMEEEERQRVNAFDWKASFPGVFKAGGFDVVIGNPPYIRIQAMKEWAPTEVEFYKKKYISASKGNYDIYVVFVEKGLNLINNHGYLGFILPSKFFATDYGEYLRDLISKRQALTKIVDFGYMQVFEQATTYTCLLFLAGSKQEFFQYGKVINPQDLIKTEFRSIKNAYSGKPWVFSDESSITLATKILTCSKPLSDLPTRIGRGSSSGADDIFMLHKEGNRYLSRQGDLVEIEPEILRTPIYATDFRRYEFHPTGNESIIFPYRVESDCYNLITENEFKKKFPKAFNYLDSRKKELEERKQYMDWYSFSAPRNLDVHETAQILVPLLADKGLYCRLSDSSSNYCLMASGGFSITVGSECSLSPNYVLGILNSKLLFWRLRSISNVFRGGWITCTKQYVETLPIRKINFNDHNEKSLHDRIKMLVESILELNIQSPRTPQEKERVRREILSTDAEIDRLVYELYGLTDEEIGIVEGRK